MCMFMYMCMFMFMFMFMFILDYLKSQKSFKKKSPSSHFSELYIYIYIFEIV